MIYGKKNYLSPRALEMGFGLLFRVDDSCVFRHLGERRERGADNEGGSVAASSMLGAGYEVEEEAEEADGADEDEVEGGGWACS